jgi:hypothetical protein
MDGLVLVFLNSLSGELSALPREVSVAAEDCRRQSGVTLAGRSKLPLFSRLPLPFLSRPLLVRPQAGVKLSTGAMLFPRLPLPSLSRSLLSRPQSGVELSPGAILCIGVTISSTLNLE